jgi:D-sedoheptulose 7-phosphate isomerase
VAGALRTAHEAGLLTIALTRAGAGAPPIADHVLAARTPDALIAREIHITIYHVLWELVHVFLDQPDALEPPDTLAQQDTLPIQTPLPMRNDVPTPDSHPAQDRPPTQDGHPAQDGRDLEADR